MRLLLLLMNKFTAKSEHLQLLLLMMMAPVAGVFISLFLLLFLLINTLSCVKLPKLIHRLTSAAAAAANSRSRRLTTLLPPPLQHFQLSSLNCSQISSNALTSSFFLPQIALKDLISDH